MIVNIRSEGTRLIGMICLTILLQPAWFFSAQAKAVPASLLKWSEQGPEHIVVVDKSAQKIFVYRRGNPFEPVEAYRCSTGENSGPKTRQNDRKTPEGVYFFTGSHGQEELAPIYGIRAFPIDYPNPFDRRIGKGGYGIWFHGTNKPLKPRDTNGCVVLENEGIEDLARYIRLNETPAIIVSAMDRVSREVLERDADLLERVIEGWRAAWESKDMDRYLSFYGGRFRAQGMDLNQWQAHKSRLARRYDTIRVDMEELQLYRANGLVLAQFRQHYHAGDFESRGRKRLYLVQNSKEYKIIGEVFDREERLTRMASAASADLSSIEGFIETWRAAWEKKDLDTYMAFYDDTFRSSQMNVIQWKRYKAELYGRSGPLSVQISDLKVTGRSERAAHVRFTQDYRSDHYRDVGVKALTLVRRGEYWKIKAETWRPLAKGTLP
jgi:murein L,D-transpeptidase YafK